MSSTKWYINNICNNRGHNFIDYDSYSMCYCGTKRSRVQDPKTEKETWNMENTNIQTQTQNVKNYFQANSGKRSIKLTELIRAEHKTGKNGDKDYNRFTFEATIDDEFNERVKFSGQHLLETAYLPVDGKEGAPFEARLISKRFDNHTFLEVEPLDNVITSNKPDIKKFIK